MEKIKKVTVHIKKWHALMALSIPALFFSWLLAATSPPHGPLAMFHMLGMVVAGIAGTLLFGIAVAQMMEEWNDA